jgi:poly-D-alanine transfer protein DltD
MKKMMTIAFAVAFVFASGFLGKNEDGSISVDTADLSAQAEAMSAKAVEKAVKAAESINVSKDEILGDLGKSMEDIKKKVGEMDPARLIAYLNQYSSVLSDTQKQVADYAAQIKDLKWTKKFSAEARELKGQLKNYTARFDQLKTQATAYIEKLESYGIDLAACGIDLSAFGL